MPICAYVYDDLTTTTTLGTCLQDKLFMVSKRSIRITFDDLLLRTTY